MNPIEEAIALLRVVWPQTEGWGELRAIGSEGALRPLFLTLPLKPDHTYRGLEWAFKKNKESYNIFYGVHQRTTARGRNVDVANYNCLIADIDNPDLSWPLIQQLTQAGCPASICVRTPRGLHLYWLLEQPEPVDKARVRMQRLQKALHSDAVHDPARILRLPGAECHKTGAHNLVYIAWLNPDVRYTSEKIDTVVQSLWPALELPPINDSLEVPAGPPVNLPVQPMAKDVWASFAAPAAKGTRSELCLSFIQHTLMLGWPPESIHAALETIPIGGHYSDRGGQAFVHDLQKAQRNVFRSLAASTRAVIDRVSIYENPPIENIPGTRKLRIKFITLNRFGTGSSFHEWILIPDEWRTNSSRWKSFLNAVGAQVNEQNPVENLLGQLPGKYLRLDLFEDGPQKVRYFFPDGALSEERI